MWLSWQRQARAQQMVWIALGLLAFVGIVGGDLDGARRLEHAALALAVPQGPTLVQWADEIQVLMSVRDGSAGGQGVQAALAAAVRGSVEQSGFTIFSHWIVFLLFLSFLLPLWNLSFATEALGGERESNSLIWLLSRPLSRPAIYLAKFVALLPWTLGLTLGGFGLLCLAAGQTGVAGVSSVLAGRAGGDAGVLGVVLSHGCVFPPSRRGRHRLCFLSGSDLRQHARLSEAHQHRFLYALYDVRCGQRVRHPAGAAGHLSAGGWRDGPERCCLV